MLGAGSYWFVTAGCADFTGRWLICGYWWNLRMTRVTAVSCFKEAIIGRPLGSFRIEVSCQKGQAFIKSLELPAPFPASGEGNGTRDWLNDWWWRLNHPWLSNETSMKVSKRLCLENLQASNTPGNRLLNMPGSRCTGKGCISSTHLTPSPNLTLSISSLSCIHYHKLSWNKVPSWILWVILENSTQEKDCGLP